MRAVVTSSVVFVTDLDRSVTFYTEVLGCRVSVRQHESAILLDENGFQLYLVARGPRAVHARGGIGDQGLMWSVESEGALDTLASECSTGGLFVDRFTAGGIDFLETRDPDNLRVIVAFPGPDIHARTAVASRFFV